jgi:hypothetical protein
MFLMAVTTAEATTAEVITAEATQVGTRSRRAIVMDWIGGRKMLAIATGTTRITQATIETAAVLTVKGFVEDTT